MKNECRKETYADRDDHIDLPLVEKEGINMTVRRLLELRTISNGLRALLERKLTAVIEDEANARTGACDGCD